MILNIEAQREENHNRRFCLYVHYGVLAGIRQYNTADTQKHIHMNDTISGVIMALDNVMALFLLPLFGINLTRLILKWERGYPLS
jgi:hypothetical protein